MGHLGSFWVKWVIFRVKKSRGGAVCKTSYFLYCIFFWKNLYCKKYFSFIEVVFEQPIYFKKFINFDQF